MGNIRDYLNEILSDVRQAIHDGIFQCYEDGKALSEMQLATEEDIDRILDGTYSDLPDDKEEGITDEEIREIVDTAFSRGE